MKKPSQIEPCPYCKAEVYCAMPTKASEDTPKPCKAVLHVGPGHQSRVSCCITGWHRQHHSGINENYFWSHQKFSGFFDESPESEGEIEPRPKRRKAARRQEKGGRKR